MNSPQVRNVSVRQRTYTALLAVALVLGALSVAAAASGCVEDDPSIALPELADSVVSSEAVFLRFQQGDVVGSGGGKPIATKPGHGNQQCRPKCRKSTCGPDGCGGICGACDASQTCQGGLCVGCAAPQTAADCADADACTVDALVPGADTCSNTCSHASVTRCAHADGCCPSGCSSATDNDCAAACGDGVVQGGETCDPPGSCPTSCASRDACTTATLVGSASTCTAACLFASVVTCRAGDGCCPSGCTASTDADCAAACGDGVVQSGETCDPPGSCPTTCASGDACTTATLEGSASTCTAACVYASVVACSGGDGCCPAGCTSSTDSDCAAPSGGLDCRNAATWPAAWVDYEDEVLGLVNAHRTAGATCRGAVMPPVAPLVMDARLRESARCHSLDMAVNRFFSHTASDGSTLAARAFDAGYTPVFVLGENIAAGHSSPSIVVSAWMSSTTGHCENVMYPTFRDLGVGYLYDSAAPYRRYWTQDFGKLY